MEVIEFTLFPIIWLMGRLLDLLRAISGEYGVAIIGLSIIVRLAMTPIGKIAERAEAKEQRIQAAMEPELTKANRELKGRERFERTEEIYKTHNYHPIQSVISLLPIGLQIPFLLSALFLLVDHSSIAGERFLIVDNLGEPDRLLPLGSLSINALPILLTVIAIYESTIRINLTRAMRIRFLIVAVVIAVLIYPLPATVCLYWLTSNVWSLGATALKNKNAIARQP